LPHAIEEAMSVHEYEQQEVHMGPINFTDLHANLASHFDRIEADKTELVVTRPDHEPMVIVALSEWEGMRETLHLLSSPANADHLRRSIRSYEEGKASEQELLDR
jgi:antitoxin YefM